MEFHDLLHAAKEKAKSDWERNFVDDLAKKFMRFSTRMFLSERQQDSLERIARGGDQR